MMKKILMILNDTTSGYIFRKEMIERLISDGYGVVVIGDCLNYQSELKAMGCRLVQIATDRRGTNPFSDLKLLAGYQRIIRNEKPDAVLTYNIKPNVYGGIACQLSHTPYLANITGLGTAVEYPGLLQKVTTRLYRIGVRKAECIFFQNQENIDFFRKRHMLAKDAHTRLIPGSGVNLKTHEVIDYPAQDQAVHFLFAARILKEKGIDLYLNAAHRIHREREDTVFHICGKCDDAGYYSRLLRLNETGYVKYHGEVKDMRPFYGAAHCIVHPTWYPEGISNVLLEAAAHGRPVITTDRAGCREAVNHGETGMIIPMRDEDALVAALKRFLDMDWQKKKEMGLAGRKKIEREFDRRLVVEAYMDELNRSLSVNQKETGGFE